MSRLNNILKFIVFQLNTILGLLGIVLFIFSAYSLFADWGDLDASFFIGISLGGVCAGISLLLISSLGSMGIEFQTKKSLPWTGKRILSLYFIFIAMGLGACCWYLYTSTDEVSSLKSARASLDTDDVKPYDYFETVLSEKFNQFYFGVESQCGEAAINSMWFWELINANCPEKMDEDHCTRCGDFWITNCEADENTCYSDYNAITGGIGSSGANPTCPYDLCREGMINYFLENLDIFIWCVIAVVIMFLILFISTAMLICYNRKDTVEEMLIKSGAITDKKKRKTTVVNSEKSPTDDAKPTSGKPVESKPANTSASGQKSTAQQPVATRKSTAQQPVATRKSTAQQPVATQKASIPVQKANMSAARRATNANNVAVATSAFVGQKNKTASKQTVGKKNRA